MKPERGSVRQPTARPPFLDYWVPRLKKTERDNHTTMTNAEAITRQNANALIRRRGDRQVIFFSVAFVARTRGEDTPKMVVCGGLAGAKHHIGGQKQQRCTHVNNYLPQFGNTSRRDGSHQAQEAGRWCLRCGKVDARMGIFI